MMIGQSTPGVPVIQVTAQGDREGREDREAGVENIDPAVLAHWDVMVDKIEL